MREEWRGGKVRAGQGWSSSSDWLIVFFQYLVLGSQGWGTHMQIFSWVCTFCQTSEGCFEVYSDAYYDVMTP